MTYQLIMTPKVENGRPQIPEKSDPPPIDKRQIITYNAVYAGLLNLGYSKTEAKRLVTLHGPSCANEDELLHRCLTVKG
jgi:hypothetical protein